MKLTPSAIPHYGSKPFTVERAMEALPDAVYLVFRSGPTPAQRIFHHGLRGGPEPFSLAPPPAWRCASHGG